MDESTADQAEERRFTEDQVERALRQMRKMSSNSREAARMVLVGGMKQELVAQLMGISKGRISTIKKTVVDKILEEREQHESQARQIEADHMHLIAFVREQWGDKVRISAPTDDIAYVGPVLARSAFYVAQSLGRDEVVVHNLAKLDVAPTIGGQVSIQYQAGRGEVMIGGRRPGRGHTR